MLGVCAEFERIAKSVIEKAEKDNASKRKRKNVDASKGTTGAKTNGTSRPTTAIPATTPNHGIKTTSLTAPPTDPSLAYSPMSNLSGHSPSIPPNWQQQQHHQQQQQYAMQHPQNGDWDGFGFPDTSGFPGDSPGSSINMNPATAFQQQPLLPPDLFSLPMNLDWNWAELSGGAYPTVENGNFGDVISDGQQQDHSQQQQQ